MRYPHLSTLALVGALVAGHAFAAPEFLTYDGKNAVQEGQGGDKKVVDGVEFWLAGSPPRKFQILGSIVDERHKSGIIGSIAMSSLEHDIAKQAHAAGGDAVILEEAQDKVTGYVGSTFGHVYGNRYAAFGGASAVSRPMESHSSRYLVVRYLPDTPAATPTAP